MPKVHRARTGVLGLFSAHAAKTIGEILDGAVCRFERCILRGAIEFSESIHL